MARRDAILRLYRSLVTQRDELRRMLGLEIFTPDAGKGDAGDLANDDAECELNTQLAALESRELLKIERAIRAIRAGHYGRCESCEKVIPIARLNALPYSTHCIGCQREQELTGRRRDVDGPDWAAADEYQRRQQDRELTLRDIDMEVPG